MKLPFNTYFYLRTQREYYSGSETPIYMADGKQWRHITHYEFVALMGNHLFTKDIAFRSHCCLNALLILKGGI